jgi:hypothetical protein
MFNYPVEKITIRFYKYKFAGFEKPVIVEAYNKIQAREGLKHFINNNPEYFNVPIINESLSLPIMGETTRVIDGVEHVWVGHYSTNNWMRMDDFKKLEEKWVERKFKN